MSNSILAQFLLIKLLKYKQWQKKVCRVFAKFSIHYKMQIATLENKAHHLQLRHSHFPWTHHQDESENPPHLISHGCSKPLERKCEVMTLGSSLKSCVSRRLHDTHISSRFLGASTQSLSFLVYSLYSFSAYFPSASCVGQSITSHVEYQRSLGNSKVTGCF